MRSIAQSSGFSSHSVAPGARYLTLVVRSGLTASWSEAAPLGHRLPSEIGDLNRLYATYPALHAHASEASGFRWLVADDAENSVLAFSRHGDDESEIAIVVSNFTPVPREGYRIGVPRPGYYREVLNTDASHYAGSNIGNRGGLQSEGVESHGLPCSVCLTLPPLATLILVLEA